MNNTNEIANNPVTAINKCLIIDGNVYHEILEKYGIAVAGIYVYLVDGYTPQYNCGCIDTTKTPELYRMMLPLIKDGYITGKLETDTVFYQHSQTPDFFVYHIPLDSDCCTINLYGLRYAYSVCG